MSTHVEETSTQSRVSLGLGPPCEAARLSESIRTIFGTFPASSAASIYHFAPPLFSILCLIELTKLH